MVENNNKDYEYYQKVGSITSIVEQEKKYYLDYLFLAYKEDIEYAKKSLFLSPKWSIIAGYYAMHNISKYYLAMNFNKKLNLPDIHNATIVAIKKLVNNKEIKELIEKAEEFSEVEPLYYGLVRAKQERSKTQYYINENTSKIDIPLEKANYFLNNVVEKYIELMLRLIENVK